VDSQEITKIVATRCHILSLKFIKFDFGWSSAPDPTGELTMQSSPDPLAGFRDLNLLIKGGREGK